MQTRTDIKTLNVNVSTISTLPGCFGGNMDDVYWLGACDCHVNEVVYLYVHL